MTVDACRMEDLVREFVAELMAELGRGSRAEPAAGKQRSAARMTHRGRGWEITLGGRSAIVRPSLGMGYLARLLANPGREIPAAELAAGSGGDRRPAASGQPLLDDQARRAYRRRLSELDTRADELEGAGDTARAATARAERAWLIAELAAATGLGGRSRRFATSDERARISVTKAIWRAVDRIADVDREIGDRLRASVQTGLRCSYQPF